MSQDLLLQLVIEKQCIKVNPFPGMRLLKVENEHRVLVSRIHIAAHTHSTMKNSLET